MTVRPERVEMAPLVLLEGALGVGEAHSCPTGRKLVQRLLEQRRVRVLFLELPPGVQRNLDLATSHLAQSDFDKAMLEARGMSAQEPYGHASPCLGELAYCALRHGTRVILADPKIGRGADDRAMRMRNTATAEVFHSALEVTSATDRSARGSLLLFGAEHFQRDWSLCTKIRGLRWVDTSPA